MSQIFSSLRLLLFIIFVSSSFVVVAETGKKPDPISVSLGKKLYEKNCQVCHQKDGVGENQVPLSIRKPGYVPAMPLNETSHAWHHGDKQLVKIILEGTPSSKRMPAWKGTLTERDAHYIVSYIKSLWSPKTLACQGAKHMGAGCR